MKKIIVLLCLLVLVAIVAIPGTVWWLSFQPEAQVTAPAKLSKADINRLQQLLVANEYQGEPVKKITFSEQDLDQLLQYGIQQAQLPLPAAARVSLNGDIASIYLSAKTSYPARPYLNLLIKLRIDGKKIIFLDGQLGSLPIPAASAGELVTAIMPYIQNSPEYRQAESIYQTIEQILISDKALSIFYQLDPATIAKIQQDQLQLIFGKTMLEALPHYQQILSTEFANRSNSRISLAEAFQPLFASAQQRSSQGADPVIENKAVIFAMALHSASPEILAVLNLSDTIRMPEQPLNFTLERRKDLGRHFLSTAAITLLASENVASLAGLYKELDDQNGASGFDVSDLIANKAGSTFVKYATSSEDRAQQFQRRILSNSSESYFFPATKPIVASVTEELMSRVNGSDEDALLQKIESTLGGEVERASLYQNFR